MHARSPGEMGTLDVLASRRSTSWNFASLFILLQLVIFCLNKLWLSLSSVEHISGFPLNLCPPDLNSLRPPNKLLFHFAAQFFLVRH